MECDEGINIKLPRKMEGIELADAIESAAREMEYHFRVSVHKYSGYEPGDSDMDVVEKHREIILRDRPGFFKKAWQMGMADFRIYFDIYAKETYESVAAKGMTTASSDFQNHKPAFDEFVGKLYTGLMMEKTEEDGGH